MNTKTIKKEIREHLIKNGWEVSKQFPTPNTLSKGTRHIILSNNNLSMELVDNTLATSSTVSYEMLFNPNDALLKHFIIN